MYLYQTFIGNVNYQNMHTLLTSIRSCDNTVSREKINDFVSQISNIFNESALLIQKSRTKYANVESNPSNKLGLDMNANQLVKNIIWPKNYITGAKATLTDRS